MKRRAAPAGSAVTDGFWHTGLSGEIPAELASLSSLEVIDLDDNQLTGAIPSEFGNLPRLRYLLARENRLSGPIPESPGSILTLQWVRLAYNQLSGPLPPELANAVGLEELMPADNRLTGPVPAEFTRLGALYAFTWVGNDGLCAPADGEFQDWVDGLSLAEGPACENQAQGARLR